MRTQRLGPRCEHVGRASAPTRRPSGPATRVETCDPSAAPTLRRGVGVAEPGRAVERACPGSRRSRSARWSTTTVAVAGGIGDPRIAVPPARRRAASRPSARRRRTGSGTRPTSAAGRSARSRCWSRRAWCASSSTRPGPSWFVVPGRRARPGPRRSRPRRRPAGRRSSTGPPVGVGGERPAARAAAVAVQRPGEASASCPRRALQRVGDHEVAVVDEEEAAVDRRCPA